MKNLNEIIIEKLRINKATKESYSYTIDNLYDEIFEHSPTLEKMYDSLVIRTKGVFKSSRLNDPDSYLYYPITNDDDLKELGKGDMSYKLMCEYIHYQMKRNYEFYICDTGFFKVMFLKYFSTESYLSVIVFLSSTNNAARSITYKIDKIYGVIDKK